MHEELVVVTADLAVDTAEYRALVIAERFAAANAFVDSRPESLIERGKEFRMRCADGVVYGEAADQRARAAFRGPTDAGQGHDFVHVRMGPQLHVHESAAAGRIALALLDPRHPIAERSLNGAIADMSAEPPVEALESRGRIPIGLDTGQQNSSAAPHDLLPHLGHQGIDH